MNKPIKYFSFFDVPRTFVFERGGQVYLLTAGFDDETDEYREAYEVYAIPGLRSVDGITDWKSVEPLPKTCIGRVPVASVVFDKSSRKSVDDAFLSNIICHNE
jgi:hypothetical protein